MGHVTQELGTQNMELRNSDLRLMKSELPVDPASRAAVPVQSVREYGIHLSDPVFSLKGTLFNQKMP